MATDTGVLTITVTDAVLKGNISGPAFTGSVDGDKFSGTMTYTDAPTPPIEQAVTLFTTQKPVILNASDGASVTYELGVKFKSSKAGTITGLKFWKGDKEASGHTGNIWSASGAKLASVTFANETASGWQTANLATPLSIDANVTYIASVGTSNSYFCTTEDGLKTSVSNPPLATIVGNNGVYGPRGACPGQTSHNNNYFRDVLFVASGSEPIPPEPPPNGNVLHATPATFAAKVSEATAGTTILLASGNYGTWAGVNKAITIAPETGANVTMGVQLNSSAGNFIIDGGHTELLSSTNGPMRTQAPPFTSPGITLTTFYFAGNTANPPQNILVKRCWISGIVGLDTYPTNAAAHWTFDRCYWNKVGTFQSPDKSIPESCFQMWGKSITLKNCFMHDCLADGVKLSQGRDITIQDSEFYKVYSGTQPTVHTDAMQWNGASNCTIIRNWFHDFEQACCAFDGTSGNTITDNVIDSRNHTGGTPAWWLCMGGDNPASSVLHNTVIGGPISCGSKPNNPLSISIIKDNIGNVDVTGIAGGANGRPTANDHNISYSSAVVFEGGATPKDYQGYKLKSGSAGIGAASDGGNVGARIT